MALRGSAVRIRIAPFNPTGYSQIKRHSLHNSIVFDLFWVNLLKFANQCRPIDWLLLFANKLGMMTISQKANSDAGKMINFI